MRRERIDIGGDHVGFHLVGRGAHGRPRVIDRIDHGSQFPRACAIAQSCECHRGPDSAVSVLAAILSHSRNVSANVSGLEIGRIERRIEKLDQPMVAANQTRIHRGHRGARARAVARAGKNRPALRDGVDLTLGIVDRTERRAVIEVGAAIPLAIPRIVLNPLVQLHRLQLAAVRERRVVPHTRDFG